MLNLQQTLRINLVFQKNETVFMSLQVLHGTDVVCDGTLKKYNTEERLPKENRPRRDCQDYNKPDKSSTGVDASPKDHLTGEHWYGLCERQNLQYGPKFQMVTKYGVDRSWCDLK